MAVERVFQNQSRKYTINPVSILYFFRMKKQYGEYTNYKHQHMCLTTESRRKHAGTPQNAGNLAAKMLRILFFPLSKPAICPHFGRKTPQWFLAVFCF
jgi:hypothetical protein